MGKIFRDSPVSSLMKHRDLAGMEELLAHEEAGSPTVQELAWQAACTTPRSTEDAQVLCQIMELALRHGANIHERRQSGWDSMLAEACDHGYAPIVELLLDHGAKLNPRDYPASHPLHDSTPPLCVAIASWEEASVDLVGRLLERGAPLVGYNPKESALWLAAEEASAPKLRLLRAAGADPTEITPDGSTLFHALLGEFSGRNPSAREQAESVLLEWGLDPRTPDHNGKSALDRVRPEQWDSHTKTLLPKLAAQEARALHQRTTQAGAPSPRRGL